MLEEVVYARGLVDLWPDDFGRGFARVVPQQLARVGFFDFPVVRKRVLQLGGPALCSRLAYFECTLLFLGDFALGDLKCEAHATGIRGLWWAFGWRL